MTAERKHVIVSGTYSTGKTTTSTALSIYTGIPLINALSAREILLDLYPGRAFQQMSVTELLALGLKRFEERVSAESELRHGMFISDGSVLNEWIYGTVRMKVGINPGAPWPQQLYKAMRGILHKGFYKRYLDAYGTVVQRHAREAYDLAFHLPIEFAMGPDGHRPVSEKYRDISDVELRQCMKDLRIPFHVVRGTLRERLACMTEYLGVTPVVSTDDAVRDATDRVRNSHEALAKRIQDQQGEGLRHRVSGMFRY